MYLVALNLLVNNQLNSSSNSTHHCGTKLSHNPQEDFLGRNPSRSLVFKQNSGVVQFGADVEIAVQVKSDEKLRVRRRGGKNLHKVRLDRSICITISY